MALKYHSDVQACASHQQSTEKEGGVTTTLQIKKIDRDHRFGELDLDLDIYHSSAYHLPTTRVAIVLALPQTPTHRILQ